MTSFYKLTNEEWLRAVHELKPRERDVLYYIRTLDPFGDRPFEIGVRSVAKILNCDPATVSRALKVLDSKGFIEAAKYVTFREQDTPEKRVRDQLHQKLGGLTEVITAVGRIDLLTDTEVIEVKQVNDWKSALGQVLAYAAFYPEHQKRIHLFGKVNPLKAVAIQSSCSDLGVSITFGEEA